MNNLTICVMDDFVNDYKNDGYTLREWVIYGVIAPMALIAIACLASTFD